MCRGGLKRIRLYPTARRLRPSALPTAAKNHEIDAMAVLRAAEAKSAVTALSQGKQAYAATVAPRTAFWRPSHDIPSHLGLSRHPGTSGVIRGHPVSQLS
ncbi:hypothetical protein amb1733 [Paramagnetospirillum magneticum AMB-1]|uniref:Uncharacterized protein n=1 Tax=Paramagnetospirillum magneticum (strain ATCC 700264 / AMB-1) TaxID=342108 RepID=Q2W6I8_PARM1|nr:hypothetical protein amb1733 [Paramagnetospirillum magneticum AMB-1]